MILPTKHISSQHSILGAGSVVLKLLNKPTTVTSLWNKVRECPGLDVYWRFVITLDFLFAIGAINIQDGLITKSQND